MPNQSPKVQLRGRSIRAALKGLNPAIPVRVYNGRALVCEGTPAYILSPAAPAKPKAKDPGIGTTLNGTSNRRVFRPRLLSRHMDALYTAVSVCQGQSPCPVGRALEDLLEAQDRLTESLGGPHAEL